MKISFTVNGKVAINLEPESKLEEVLLSEMHQGAEKGKVYIIYTVHDMDITRYVISES